MKKTPFHTLRLTSLAAIFAVSSSLTPLITASSAAAQSSSYSPWSQITGKAHGTTGDARIYNTQVQVSTGGVYITGAGQNLYVSIDSGATWTDRTIADSDPNHTYDYTLSDNGALLIAKYSGASNTSIDAPLLISTDAGAHWTHHTSEGIYSWNTVSISEDGSRILAIGYDSENTRHAFSSTNGGITWSELLIPHAKIEQTISVSNDGLTLATIAPNTALGNTNYLYISTDGGATWREESLYINEQTVNSTNQITLSDTGSVLTLQGTLGTLLVSVDNGENWTTRTASVGSFLNVDTTDDGTIAATTYNAESNSYHLLVSQDYGANWIEHTPRADGWWQFVSISADGSAINVWTRQSVGPRAYTSTNGGVTWHQAAPASNGLWQEVDSTYNGQVIGTLGLRTYFSQDAGAQWQESADLWENIPN